jgi:tRNA 2-selenouridine synthase
MAPERVGRAPATRLDRPPPRARDAPMIRIALTALTDLDRLGIDEILDTRSPAEWAEDHLPGAVNLPVLDDAERARVGTIYTRDSRFLARRIGAALVARNAARHLEGYLADKPADYRPLVYCWRGGQRSGSFALILGQIGWQVRVLEGGWRAWRRLVVQALYDRPFPAPVVLLDGDTGTAKTALLHEAARQGAQTLDLEGLARHRGSIFGATGPQPAQKRFESDLALAVARLDPARPVLIEAESARIGDLRLPPGLWAAMRAAPRIELAAPLAERAAHLARAYHDLVVDPARLARQIAALAPLHPKERVAQWHALVGEGAHTDLAADLMRHHYDPRYARLRSAAPPPAARIAAMSLAPGDLPALAARVIAALP